MKLKITMRTFQNNNPYSQIPGRLRTKILVFSKAARYAFRANEKRRRANCQFCVVLSGSSPLVQSQPPSPPEPRRHSRTKKGSLFCGARASSALEVGGIGEPLTTFTVSFKHTLTACWIHIKLHCHLAALLEFCAQFAIGQN